MVNPQIQMTQPVSPIDIEVPPLLWKYSIFFIVMLALPSSSTLVSDDGSFLGWVLLSFLTFRHQSCALGLGPSAWVFCCVKKKFSWIHFKEPIGFIQWFTKWAASCLQTERSSEEQYKMKDFYRQKRGGARKSRQANKAGWLWPGDLASGDGRGPREWGSGGVCLPGLRFHFWDSWNHN